MKNYIFLLLFVVQFIQTIYAYRYNYGRKVKQFEVSQKYGDPLILTPFLEANQSDEARQAARVNYSEFQNITSYSGFFTVDKNHNSNQFFWFFPSENDYKNDPVVLWLQGGPGASSLFALFAENGPFIIDHNLNVSIRETYWSQLHSVLYIDNPVGTGFSFTNPDGYAQNETKVGSDLYNALIQFFMLFPELQSNDFYISGESYAGKYVPALGYTIHQNNPTADLKINLKGLLIGNGWTDPFNQLDYGEYLYQAGLVDIHQKETIDGYKAEGQRLILAEKFEAAADYTDNLILNSIGDFAGLVDIYNFLKVKVDPNEEIYEEFVQTVVRAELHVGSTVFSDGEEVYWNLVNDTAQSVAPWLSELLSNYQVLIYAGQVDTVCPYPLIVNFLQKLNFSSAEEYKTAQREIWVVDNDVAGYIKKAGNLTELLVRNSGHYVPRDQPKWTISFLSRFTRGLPLNDD